MTKKFLENLNVGSNESSVEMKQMLNIYLSINKCIFLCNISYYFGLCSGVAIKMLENIAFKMDLFSFQNAPNLAFLYFQRVRNFNFKVQETKYLSLLVQKFWKFQNLLNLTLKSQIFQNVVFIPEILNSIFRFLYSVLLRIFSVHFFLSNYAKK